MSSPQVFGPYFTLVVFLIAAFVAVGREFWMAKGLDKAYPLGRVSLAIPIAVFGASREIEYGLAFYRNQVVARYESGNVPSEEHLLVAPTTWMDNVAHQTAGRKVSFLGHYAAQGVDYYWVAAAGTTR